LDKTSDVVEAFNIIEINHMDEHEIDDLMEEIMHMNLIHI
jgi:hypothetical protein